METTQQTELDLRRSIYDRLMGGGTMPTMEELSTTARLPLATIRASLARLADAHQLVLQRDGEILMANPFSAVPTPFVVSASEHSWYANCIWDAMGVAAMLHRPVTIDASCGCCGTALTLRVPQDCSDQNAARAHFAIPAAHWWDDIVFN
jgi:Alkylmercury lyase